MVANSDIEFEFEFTTKVQHEFEFKLEFEFVLWIMGVNCTELALHLTIDGQDGGEGLILLWRLM